MKNLKKLAAGGMALACIASTGVSTFAAEGKTDVSYDNSNQVVDPSDPTWAVRIPSGMQFEADKKQIPANIELVLKNGNIVWPNNVDVFVKSTNGYKMLLENVAGADDVTYTLSYDTTLTGTTETQIATLNKATPKKLGTAFMDGSAKREGNHTDILTYRAVKR